MALTKCGTDPDEIIRLQEEGYSYREICDSTGATLGQVQYILHTAGRKPKHKVKTEIPAHPVLDRGKIHALYRAGWPIEKIADEMRCSTCEISKEIGRYCRT